MMMILPNMEWLLNHSMSHDSEPFDFEEETGDFMAMSYHGINPYTGKKIRSNDSCPSTTIMIGDNYNTDILGVMNYGLDAIIFNRRLIDTKILECQPTYVVNKLQRLAIY